MSTPKFQTQQYIVDQKKWYHTHHKVSNYFYIHFGDDWHPLAIVTLTILTARCQGIYLQTCVSETTYLSKLLSAEEDLTVVPVTTIHSVVSILQEVNIIEDWQILEVWKVSLMHHTFLELAQFSNGELFEGEDDEDSSTTWEYHRDSMWLLPANCMSSFFIWNILNDRGFNLRRVMLALSVSLVWVNALTISLSKVVCIVLLNLII